MREYNVPKLGYIKLKAGDIMYMGLGVGFTLLGLTTPVDGFNSTLVLAGLQVVVGILLVLVNIFHGRRRIKREELANPISQLEAWQNHMAAEGHQ